MINYTIIIPHKNSAELLDYCLASIPVRDDVQVVVIDDNSDAEKVDIGHFPKWKGRYYEYYLTKEGKGAGYCRNVGLEHAKGKWVLFVDADDYVLPCIDEIFDRSVDCEADIIFFRPTAVMLKDRKTPSTRDDFYNNIIDEYFQTGDEEKLRTCFYSPTCKFVRRKLIVDNHIRFDEIRYSNDNYFAVAIGCYAKKIEVNDDTYYVITQGENSLTSNFLKKPGELACRAGAFFRASNMILQYGYKLNDAYALYLMRLLYDKENRLYSKGFFVLKSYFQCNIFQMSNKIFRDYSAKHKLFCFVHSVIIVYYYKWVKSISTKIGFLSI